MHHQRRQSYKSPQLKLCYSCHNATLPWIGVDNIHHKTDHCCQLWQTQHLKRHNVPTAPSVVTSANECCLAELWKAFIYKNLVKVHKGVCPRIFTRLGKEILSKNHFCKKFLLASLNNAIQTLKPESKLQKDNSWLYWQISQKEDRFTRLNLMQSTRRPCKEKLLV